MKKLIAKNSKERTSVPVRPYKEAWDDIKDALNKTKPKFKSAKEAIAWTRKRAKSL